MKLEKAIEIVDELPDNLNNVLDYDQQDALKLLIGAGKRELESRHFLNLPYPTPLPGETDE